MFLAPSHIDGVCTSLDCGAPGPAAGTEIMSARLPRVVLCLAVTLLAASCSEVRGRRQVQEANRLYNDGNYKEAVAAYDEAEQVRPQPAAAVAEQGLHLPADPGARRQDAREPGRRQVRPRGASTATRSWRRRIRAARCCTSRRCSTATSTSCWPRCSRSGSRRTRATSRRSTACIQVYSKWNKLEEALEWYARKAEILSNDAEAQYGAGVFIYTQLFQKGGGPEKSTHDPRPDPNKPREVKQHPGFGPGDIVSQQRVDLADTGIKYLEKAVALRPKYPEAMTYINLLYRQKSYAYFEYPDDWQKCVDHAVRWAEQVVRGQRPAGSAQHPDGRRQPSRSARPRRPPAAADKAGAARRAPRARKGKARKARQARSQALVGRFRRVSKWPSRHSSPRTKPSRRSGGGSPTRCRSACTGLAGRRRRLLVLARRGAVAAQRHASPSWPRRRRRRRRRRRPRRRRPRSSRRSRPRSSSRSRTRSYQPKEKPPEPEEEDDGVEGGVEGGVVGGVVGGTVGADLGNTGPVMVAPNVGTGQRICDLQNDPQYKPSLPPALNRAGMVGLGSVQDLRDRAGHRRRSEHDQARRSTGERRLDGEDQVVAVQALLGQRPRGAVLPPGASAKSGHRTDRVAEAQFSTESVRDKKETRSHGFFAGRTLDPDGLGGQGRRHHPATSCPCIRSASPSSGS